MADDGAEVVSPGVDCAARQQWSIPVGATFAYWRVATSRVWAGPAVSTAIAVDLLPLVRRSGGSAGALAGGGSVQTTQGGGAASLAGGGGALGLNDGAGSSRIGGGSGSAAIGAGGGSSELAGGSGQASLTVGSGAAQLLVVEKVSDADSVFENSSSAFTIRVRNVGTIQVTEFVVVDRIAEQVEVTSAQDARIYPAERGGSVIVWHSHRVLPPAQSESLTVQFEVRPQESAQ